MNRTRRVCLVVMTCIVMLFTTACGKDNTPFSHGSWSGNTYTSDFFGIRVQLGSEWLVIDDADLAKSVGVSDMSESSIQKVFDKGGTIREMIAARADGSSINITVQDSDKTVALSEKDFFNLGLTFIKSQYESMGQKCTVEKSSVNFLGKATDCLDISLTQNGKTLYCTLIPIFKSHYTACIAFGSLSKPDLYLLLAMASAI